MCFGSRIYLEVIGSNCKCSISCFCLVVEVDTGVYASLVLNGSYLFIDVMFSIQCLQNSYVGA